MANSRNPKRRKDGSQPRNDVRSSASSGGISIAICGANQAPINVTHVSSGGGTPPIPWQVSFVKGSSCHLKSGVAGTLNALNGHHRECISSNATVILGTLDGVLMETIPSNRASWQIPLASDVFADFARGFLAIGCLRYYGGLHSRRYDSRATISVNDRPLDRILLRIKPEGHSDYFCQLPKPDLWPSPAPFAECRTSYVWPLIRDHLIDAGSQTVEVDLDGFGNWDIDYVGIVSQKAHGHAV